MLTILIQVLEVFALRHLNDESVAVTAWVERRGMNVENPQKGRKRPVEQPEKEEGLTLTSRGEEFLTWCGRLYNSFPHLVRLYSCYRVILSFPRIFHPSLLFRYLEGEKDEQRMKHLSRKPHRLPDHISPPNSVFIGSKLCLHWLSQFLPSDVSSWKLASLTYQERRSVTGCSGQLFDYLRVPCQENRCCHSYLSSFSVLFLHSLWRTFFLNHFFTKPSSPSQDWELWWEGEESTGIRNQTYHQRYHSRPNTDCPSFPPFLLP